MDLTHRTLQMIIWHLSEFGIVQKVAFFATALQKRESVAPNVETIRTTGVLRAEANLA